MAVLCAPPLFYFLTHSSFRLKYGGALCHLTQAPSKPWPSRPLSVDAIEVQSNRGNIAKFPTLTRWYAGLSPRQPWPRTVNCPLTPVRGRPDPDPGASRRSLCLYRSSRFLPSPHAWPVAHAAIPRAHETRLLRFTEALCVSKPAQSRTGRRLRQARALAEIRLNGTEFGSHDNLSTLGKLILRSGAGREGCQSVRGYRSITASRSRRARH